ncbi:MAG: NUDIX domain-containing protein [Chloroflexi bacterium]|nr:NUDIX domain-containing protein [Chloroflexota bacterium]
MKNALLRLAYKVYSLKWRITRPIMLGVRIILIHEEQVVLVRHSYQEQWYFPGGLVNRGETMAQAAMREAWEEVGAVFTREPELLGIYLSSFERKSDHIAVFYTDAFTLQQPTDRWEIAERGTFALQRLPVDLSPGCKRRMADYLAGNGPYMGKW